MSGRQRRQLVVTGLALLALLAAAGSLLAAPGAALDLSKSASLGVDAFDVHLVANETYLAVVWSQGYDAGAGWYGRIQLRAAQLSSGWLRTVMANAPTATTWAKEPDVVFDPAHGDRAYLAWVDCRSQASNCDTVSLAACTLSNMACSPLPAVIETGSSLATPALAVDGEGRVHLAYRNDTAGRLEYRRYTAGAWETAVPIPGAAGSSREPDLAWSQPAPAAQTQGAGRLHLVWLQQDADRVRYSADDPAGAGWDDLNAASWGAPAVHTQAGQPAVAANGDRVYVAWNAKTLGDQYAPAFDWSEDGGATWQDVAGSTGSGRCSLVANTGDGCGVPNLANVAATHYSAPQVGLRPSLAISGTLPAIAWQFRDLAGVVARYRVAYRTSISGSDTLTWSSPVTIAGSVDYDGDGSPDDSMSPALAVSGGVHVAHVGLWGAAEAWDVYYRGPVVAEVAANGVYLPVVLKGAR
jgi:hypothetical protein